MNSPINGVNDALRIQLSEANQRSRMYAQRFWQLPFAYISVVGIALAGTGKGDPKIILLGAITLCLMGLLIFWIMVGTFRAIGKSVEVIIQTEGDLGLPISVKKHHWVVDLPNFALVLVGVVICIIAACMVNLPAQRSGFPDKEVGNYSTTSVDRGKRSELEGNKEVITKPNKRVQGTAQKPRRP